MKKFLLAMDIGNVCVKIDHGGAACDKIVNPTLHIIEK